LPTLRQTPGAGAKQQLGFASPSMSSLRVGGLKLHR
jgi:hypothetical protein